jgi:acetyl esterase/lipase
MAVIKLVGPRHQFPMNTFKSILFLLFYCITLNTASSQSYTLPLWPAGKVPNQIKTDEREVRDTAEIVRIGKVQTPDITVYLPSKRSATGQAVVICPGGGYNVLAYDWEGSDVAKWFNSKGIAAIVLKYRLPSPVSSITPHLTPLTDAKRAMRLVRHNASKWNINPTEIGIMGFSAGGHLASTLSVQYDLGDPANADPIERISSRPDFSILIYPVISSDNYNVHRGSYRNLLGENPDPQLLELYSAEKQVKNDTPPAILIHSADDKSVSANNSIVYFNALLEKNIPAELHIYPYGGHGYSLAVGRGHLSTWPDRIIEWMGTLRKD